MSLPICLQEGKSVSVLELHVVDSSFLRVVRSVIMCLSSHLLTVSNDLQFVNLILHHAFLCCL